MLELSCDQQTRTDRLEEELREEDDKKLWGGGGLHLTLSWMNGEKSRGLFENIGHAAGTLGKNLNVCTPYKLYNKEVFDFFIKLR